MNLPKDNHTLLKEFADFLSGSGLSSVSVKNYVSDLRNFFIYLELNGNPDLRNLYLNISKYNKEYQNNQKDLFTPANTINRRLASIRRLTTYLKVRYFSSEDIQIQQIDQNTSPLSSSTISSSDSSKQTNTPTSSQKIIDQFSSFLKSEKKTHSTIKNYCSDLYHYFNWIAKHTPFNTHHLSQVLSKQQLTSYVAFLKLSQTTPSVINRRQSSIKKLTSFCHKQGYIEVNPFEYIQTDAKLSPLSWLKRHLPKPKNPSNAPKSRLAKVYYNYHQLPFTPYLHLALLVIATTTMALLAYNQVIKNAKPSSAATTLTPPRRQLSFQGRLSDSAGTPIVTTVNVNFKLWDQLSGGTEGTCTSAGGEDCLYKTGTCSVTPDNQGIFNSLIGDGTCGSEIPMSVFADNRDIFLEVGVGAETLTPRQQIATVGYALNSETLQGYPASAAATINTVPVVDNNGDINIAVASPSIVSTSGNFSIVGQSLSLTTATNSGGDIVLQPDALGSGQILAIGGTTTEDTFRITNSNLTSGSLLSGYIGNDVATGSGNLLLLSSGATETAKFRVTADGRTTISTATVSAITAALIVDQNGTGDIFTGSASGVTKFNIGNSGSINTIDGVAHTIDDVTGNLTLTSNSNTISLNDNVTFAGTTTLNGQTYTWPASQTNNYVLQTNGSGTLSWVDPSTAISAANPWLEANGSLFPKNSTIDFLFGGQATTSAKFAVLNVNSGTPVASISSGLSGVSSFLTADGTLATTNNQTLTIGNSTTGNIIIGTGTKTLAIDSSTWDITGAGIASGLTGLSSSGTITFSGLTANRLVSTTTGGQLTTSITSANMASSITNETGTGVVVFGTSPTITTRITINGDASTSGSYVLTGANSSIDTLNGSNLDFLTSVGGDAGLTSKMLLTNSGNLGIGDSTPANLFTVGSGDLFQIDTLGRIVNLDGVAHTIDDVAGDLTLTSNSNNITLNDNVTFAGTTTLNGQTYTWPASAGSNTYVLQTNGSGTLSWVAQSGGTSYWGQANGTLYPLNSTVDFLLGGQATSSAKFAVLNMNSGTPTATIAGTVANAALFFDGNGNLSTTNRRDLVLGNSATYDSTGNILLNPNGTGNVGIGTTTPTAKLDVVGDASVSASFVTRSATPTIDILNGGSLNFATSVGGDAGLTNRMTLLNSGNVGIGTTNPAGKLNILKSTAFNLGSTEVGQDNIFLNDNGGVQGANAYGPSIGFGRVGESSVERRASISSIQLDADPDRVGLAFLTHPSGAFTDDLSEAMRIGLNGNLGIGTTTPTAKLDVAGDASTSGSFVTNGVTPTVDILNGSNLNFATSVGGDAGLTNRMTLLNSGNFGIGDSTPANLFTVGTGDLFQIDTLGRIVNLDGVAHTIDDVAGNLTLTSNSNTISLNDNVSFAGTTTLNSQTYTWPGSAGSNGYVLQTNGSGTLSWVDPATAISAANPWQEANGTIFPKNSTVDFLFGGQASDSAKFAVLNINSGTPVASISSGISGVSSFLTADGNLATTNNQTLTIGNSTTGNISIATGSKSVTINSDTWDVTAAGIASGFTGLSSSGTINFSGLTASSAVYTDRSSNLTTVAPTTGILGFWQRASGSLAPWFISDSINIGGTSTASALVHLGGTSGKTSFFMEPLAIGFNTAITNPGIGGSFTALQVDGDILPGIDDDAYLGRASTAWSRLYLSNGINNSAGTEQISILNRNLTGGQWNATSTFRVGDSTKSMPTGIEFYTVGDASVSATFTAGGNSRIIGQLDVDGNVVIGGGTGKLDVGTVDPPYTINGEKYATYLSGMIGVKEETTGTITTNEYLENIGYRKTINFNNQVKGSDLWLFSKTTNLKENLNRMSVLLTPSSQAKTWYEINEDNNTLNIYSSSPGNISYRLSAPRFDAANWTNTRTAGVEGFVLNVDEDFVSENNSNENINYSAQIEKIDGRFALLINEQEKREIGNFSNSLIANLKSGLAVINELVTDNLIVTNKLVSPLADINELNAINATISGTLTADNIKSKTIDKLSEQLDLINDKYSTASAILASIQDRLNQVETTTGTTEDGDVDPLQLSPLSTTSAQLPEDLANDSLTLQTLYTSDILANGSIFTQSLSSFESDLFIQPTGDKPVHILANLLNLYPNGQVVVQGDLLVTGNIFANNLDTRTATISGTLALGINNTQIATDSGKLLAVFGNQGEEVGSIDISGSANFNTLQTSGLVIASQNGSDSSVSGTITSNSTIGTASIATGSAEIFIQNNQVNTQTLIYITPISDTNNQVLYVKSKQACSEITNCTPGFTVAVPQILEKETSFNYWLVQTI